LLGEGPEGRLVKGQGRFRRGREVDGEEQAADGLAARLDAPLKVFESDIDRALANRENGLRADTAITPCCAARRRREDQIRLGRFSEQKQSQQGPERHWMD